MYLTTFSLKDKELGIVSSLPSKKKISSSSSTLISMPTRRDSIGCHSSAQGSGARMGRKKDVVIASHQGDTSMEKDGGMQAKADLYKHNDELAKQLEHMEQKLEELLDIVVSKCRQMNISEKQQLRNLIQTLSPKNQDRVVQIIKCRKLPRGGKSFYDLNIGLDKEDEGWLGNADKVSAPEFAKVLMERKVVSKLEPLMANLTSDPDVTAQTAPVQYYAKMAFFVACEQGTQHMDALLQIISDSAIQAFQQI
ncbi:hypothetical protein C5167_014756 [Papaver somniferum]|uniref:NET domain-containing protein n=1 Tax=Papaver somniferum TaxID=3469 RepID=A0A4Y7J824_PAPSO|nr:hypothetical protein C5167_014756 [Papaver somniferum]